MSVTNITYETNQISLLLDSMMSGKLNFIFYLFYCNLKEKDPNRKKTIVKKLLIYEISITIILACQKLGLVGSIQ